MNEQERQKTKAEYYHPDDSEPPSMEGALEKVEQAMNSLRVPAFRAELRSAYGYYMAAVRRYQIASCRRIRHKAELDRAILQAYKSGEISGKNDKERSVAELEHFGREFRRLWRLEIVEQERRDSRDMWAIEIEKLRAMLRTYEVEVLRAKLED